MLILQDDSLLALFCSVDDFCQANISLLQAQSLPHKGKRNRARSLTQSEIITLLVAFQQSHFRDFKAFYLGFVCQFWRAAFPKLVSYNRFIEYVPSVLNLIYGYLLSLLGTCHGIIYLDSTALAVCHNRRIHQHRVFKDSAKRGKTSVDWFFGFKLHLAINELGELVAIILTSGNVHDVSVVADLLRGLSGKVYADKGYLSQPLIEHLAQQGIELITKLRKNMKPRSLSEVDEYLLSKRSFVETVIDQIKNGAQIEHTRHRSGTGFIANLLASFVAYCRQPKKPSLNLRVVLPTASA